MTPAEARMEFDRVQEQMGKLAHAELKAIGARHPIPDTPPLRSSDGVWQAYFAEVKPLRDARATAEKAALEAVRATAEYRALASRAADMKAILDRAACAAELRKRGVPGRWANELVEREPDDTEAIRCVRELLRAPEGTLLLLGAPGTGKTYAAAWAIRQHPEVTDSAYVQRRYYVLPPVLLISAPQLARRSYYAARDDSEGTGPLRDAELLAIDDVGAEFSDKAGMFGALLDDLLCSRHAAGDKRTIVTSNLSVADWRARYQDRALDRIREAGRLVTLTGPSLRRRPS